MPRVSELFPGIACQTRIWITDKGRKGLDKARDPYLRGKMERWAKEGLWNYLGHDFPLASEGGNVFRLGDRNNRTRVGGYFEHGNVHGGDFIIITVIKKGGQKFPQEVIAEIQATMSEEIVRYVRAAR